MIFRRLMAMTAIWVLGRQVWLVLALFSIGIASGVAAREDKPARRITSETTAWQVSRERTVFEVNDHEVLNPINSGRWRLSGVLEVRFGGRVQPHENSVFRLFDSGVENIEGSFDRVELPEGWRYELKYDQNAHTVTLSNLRPDRAPAFPGAEGFGKYTLGGRGGKVIEVTHLDDRGPGSFRAACMAEDRERSYFVSPGRLRSSPS